MLNKKITPSQSAAIVVWGTNLGLTVGLSNYTNYMRNSINLPNYQYSVIIGLLLSDGWLQLSSTRAKTYNITNLNARLGFGQSYNKSPYLIFVFSILGHYCSNLPILMKMKLKGKVYPGLRFFTRALPCFTQLYPLFYKNKIKFVPTDIYNMLDPIAFAHWIMGDGSSSAPGLVLCTDSFTIKDVVRLMNVLIIRYDLICTLHKSAPNQYRIYISGKSMQKLHQIVSPYIIPTMFYKLGL